MVTDSIENINIRTGEVEMIQIKLRVKRFNFVIAKVENFAYFNGRYD